LPADHATARRDAARHCSIQRVLRRSQAASPRLGIKRNHLAIIATHDDARAIGRRAQDPPLWTATGEISPSALAICDTLLGADKAGLIAEEVHRGTGMPSASGRTRSVTETMEAA